MKIAPAASLVVFVLAERQFALGISVVERIVRAVEITPLPGAPAGVRGAINVEGRVIPVLDLRAHFGIPARELRATDHLVLVHTAHGSVALLVDSVAGVIPRNESEADETTPVGDGIAGATTLAGGIVFIHDIDRFLSPEAEPAVDAARKG